jgi:cytochrome c
MKFEYPKREVIRMSKVTISLFVVIFFCTQPAEAADLKRGELLLQTCTACHAITGDGLGPDLHNIVGRKSAQITGFEYSTAMNNAKLKWDRKTLVAFIANPQAVVKGTTMTFPGYANKADIDDVMAALTRLK